MRDAMENKRAKCPFFIGCGDNFIVCESVFPRDTGATCRTNYKRGKEMKKQMEMYCCENWERCELARSIAHWRYEGDDD